MKTRSKIVLGLLIVAMVALEVTALLSFLRQERQQMAYAPKPAQIIVGRSARSALPIVGSSSTASQQGLLSTPANTVTLPSTNYQPTVSTGLLLYRTSSKTVRQVEGGAMTISPAGNTRHTTGRGIKTTTSSGASIETPALALTSIPLAARYLQDGMTAEQELRAATPRRTTLQEGNGDKAYGTGTKPPYDPTDPFFTPIGDVPWAFILLLLICFASILRRRGFPSE